MRRGARQRAPLRIVCALIVGSRACGDRHRDLVGSPADAEPWT